MASYESDEEQIEALKRWWAENGNSLIVGIVIILVVLFGSRQWQGAQIEKAETASDLYESMLPPVALFQSETLDETGMAELESSYNALRNEHTDTIYARYGALLMAGVYAGQENYDQAAAELNWVLENQELGFMQSAEEELYLTTRLRLARIRLAQGEPQQALDLVTSVDPLELGAGFAEVQGDAYSQLGQAEQSRSAYQRALNFAPENSGLIELKMRAIGG